MIRYRYPLYHTDVYSCDIRKEEREDVRFTLPAEMVNACALIFQDLHICMSGKDLIHVRSLLDRQNKE